MITSAVVLRAGATMAKSQPPAHLVAPQTVLASGDRVRFRFNSSVAGWLSVYYAGSGGQADWLLPSRLVTKDTPFLVPAEPASYTIEGPPGLDVLYWIVSPKQVPLESLVPSGARRQVPHTLVPRCRGGKEPEAAALACLDDRAGPVRLRARELRSILGRVSPSAQREFQYRLP